MDSFCSYQSIIKELRTFKNPEKEHIFLRFFKTKKGEYGEGDRFWGIVVPTLRLVVKKYRTLSLLDVEKLIEHPIHECRLTGLLILVEQFNKADEDTQKKIVEMYLSHLNYINNWDLVDLSAPHIIGHFLLNKPRVLLFDLAQSPDVWRRRIAILSTFTFIRNGDTKDTYAIAQKLMHDQHDLIHKAVGWMLREAGKRKKNELEIFIETYAPTMPRTMLRYAIEKFSEDKRKYYLHLK